MFRTYYNKETKLWSGTSLSSIFDPKISLGEIIFRALINNGSKIAQISDDSGVQMTFDDIRIRSVRAAMNLQKLGYKSQDILGFVARNSKDVASIAFASLFIGCPLSTFNPTFGRNELIHMLKTTRPCLMFCDIEVYDLVEQCLNEVGLTVDIFTIGGVKGQSKNVESLFIETVEEDEFLPIKVDGENQIAFIVCSSGTTGLSKGVCLTHGRFAQMIQECMFVNSEDVMLCFSPLDWITGAMTLIIGTIFGAKRLITKNVFSPKLQLLLIERYRVTFLLNSPHQIGLILKNEDIHTRDLSSLRCEILGGSRVPADMPEQWNKYLRDGKNVNVTYGISEAGGIVSSDYPASGKKGTVGRLGNGCSAKIMDKNGNRCGPNVDGEICVKTGFGTCGYYNNEAATRDLFDKEGFLLTGDIGHFDDDGDLFIVDRKKDILIFEAEHVPPGEIEDFLIKHPDIDSVCVVGIPDSMGSDLPAAAIIRKGNAGINEQDVYNMVADHFADYYKLRGGIYFVDSFPVSSAGKILKREIKALIIGKIQRKQNKTN